MCSLDCLQLVSFWAYISSTKKKGQLNELTFSRSVLEARREIDEPIALTIVWAHLGLIVTTFEFQATCRIAKSRVSNGEILQQLQSQIELFPGSLPSHPYCANDVTAGLRIRNVEHALKHRYIQPNHPNSKLWLVYDIDRPTCVSEITDDLLLPAPHFFVQNKRTQRAHAYYGLETPVHLNVHSSQKATRFAAAVDCALTSKMDADAAYSGLIAKNPVHEHWRTYTINSKYYELGEISDYLDLDKYGDRRRSLPETGLGRNVNLFNRLRHWAYKAIRQGWPDSAQWDKAVLDRAIGYNAAGYHDESQRSPLPHGEVRSTAKSVAKWTYKHFSPEGFSEVQAARGKRKGQKRRDELLPKVLEMKSQGASIRQISKVFDVPKSTISEWVSGSHIR